MFPKRLFYVTDTQSFPQQSGDDSYGEMVGPSATSAPHRDSPAPYPQQAKKMILPNQDTQLMSSTQNIPNRHYLVGNSTANIAYNDVNRLARSEAPPKSKKSRGPRQKSLKDQEVGFHPLVPEKHVRHSSFNQQDFEQPEVRQPRTLNRGRLVSEH